MRGLPMSTGFSRVATPEVLLTHQRVRPDAIRANALAAAAVRPRDHFEIMTVGVRKIDAASAVIVIDLPRSSACRVGPIVQVLRLDPLQHGVELRFGDQKRVMLWRDRTVTVREIH